MACTPPHQRRLVRISGAAAVLGVAVMAAGTASAASVDGCTVVARPTASHHTTCRGADLRGADFAGRDLRHADFRGASLQRADFTGARLDRARMQLANLTRARLRGVRAPAARMTAAGLTRADLTGADLRGARLNGTILFTRADLTNADLTGADMGSALLMNATITGADLTGARLSNVGSGGLVGQPRALPPGWRLVQGWLAGPRANLWGAVFTDADLSGIDLTGANLIYSEIDGNTTLRGTPLTGTLQDGISWNWDFSANNWAGGPDGGTVTCPDGSAAIPGYASGLPGVGPVGC